MVKRTRHRNLNTSGTGLESEILEGYLRVALKEGVENVTLKKVAAEAKVAYSTVHYYFGQSSSCLVENALQYVAKASEEFMSERLNSVSNLMDTSSLFTYVKAKFEWNKKFPTYASMMFYFFYLTTRDKEVKKLSTTLYHANLKRLQTLCLQDSGKGIFGKIRDGEQLAAKIQNIMIGALLTDASSDANKNGQIQEIAISLISEQLKLHS